MLEPAPLLVGGASPRTMRLAARHADAWSAFLIGGACTAERLAPLLARLDEACAAEGREPASLQRSAGIMVALSDEPFLVGSADWTAGALRGSPEELASALRAFAALGVGLVQVGISPVTSTAVEEFGRVLERLDAGG